MAEIKSTRPSIAANKIPRKLLSSANLIANHAVQGDTGFPAHIRRDCSDKGSPRSLP